MSGYPPPWHTDNETMDKIMDSVTQQKKKHTPTPWRLEDGWEEYGHPDFITSEGGTICLLYDRMEEYLPNREEVLPNACRIVAAVNATEGIPTEALESGIVAELVEALEYDGWLEDLLLHTAKVVDRQGFGDLAKCLRQKHEKVQAALAKARPERVEEQAT